MASTIVSRTQSGAESAAGRRTWTFSCWFKRSKLGNFELFGSDSDGARNNNFFIIDFRSTDEIDMAEYISGYQLRFITNRKFRDTSAWYHLVVAFDTTQSTASDRVKIYVNGVQETSFSTATYPSQDYQTKMFAQNKIHAFGRSGYQIDGILSHCHATEGTAYAPTAFGETDSTTGEWKIKTDVSVSYGTNGFFLFKDDNAVTNQAGNSSGNFAVTAGTLTKTEDCPDNVFATMATPTWYDGTIANGGNTVTTNQSNYRYQAASLGVSSGKWYWEVKLSTAASWGLIGITDEPSYQTGSTNILGSETYDYAIYYGSDGSTGSGGGHLFNNAGANPGNTPGGFMGAISQGDIFTFALDLDSATKKLYIGTNGSWSNGSNATDQTFANSTGKTITAPSSTNTGFYFPAVGDYAGSSTSVFQFNFGNGYFGTTVVASAGTNASGIGIFEFDVPTGYTALSTKGLNL